MTTPNLYDEKEVMEEFISCYRHFSALWDNSSMDYLSKKKKEPGYQELLKILRRVNRGASVQDVKRKINSLRCCYRREIKKIRISYNTYEPRLWWFHMMDFLKPVLNLNDVATPTSSPSSNCVKQESQSLYDSLDEASMHEFFRLYRSMPELWLANSKDYRNRKLKAQSYDRLLLHLRQADPNSNIHMLKRKINNLRTSYRRELRKVLDSKSLGHGDEYIPSLWYFNELDFLYEEETGEAQTLIANEHHEYHKENISDAGDIVEAETVENAAAVDHEVADEDIFAEPFQPEEDMLVIEGEGEEEGEGDGEGEGEVDADADADGVADVVVEEEGRMEDETQLKTVLKMENKYQTHSNSNNSNNNNNNKHAYSRLHSHTHSHPYATNQTSQLQSRRSGVGVGVGGSVAPVSALRRRRRSSIVDDLEESSAVAAATSTAKKRRQMIDHMVSRSVEHAENECDLIGKRMAAHFRNMRPDQRLFAERIISEVLVYGRMNRLSLDARFLPNGGGVSSSSHNNNNIPINTTSSSSVD
ncbi:hypothetical protein ACLKA6_002090 [Drosophila palustris]